MRTLIKTQFINKEISK